MALGSTVIGNSSILDFGFWILDFISETSGGYAQARGPLIATARNQPSSLPLISALELRVGQQNQPHLVRGSTRSGWNSHRHACKSAVGRRASRRNRLDTACRQAR